MTRSRRRILDTANTVVPIAVACGLVGISVPDGIESSWKTDCPNSVYHDDGQRTFRIYPDTNSGWCFGPCGYFSPVSVYTARRDVDPELAAQILLDHVGHRTVDTLTFWEAKPDPVPDTASLGAALKMWAARTIPGWEMGQFDSLSAQTLSRCLDALVHVHTNNDAEHWLAAAKIALERTSHVTR